MNIHLYQGNPREGWNLLTEDWPKIQKEGFLKIFLYRYDIYILQGRTALAIAQQKEDGWEEFLRIAEKAAKILLKGSRFNSPAQGILLQSGIAMLKNDPRTAVSLLQESLRLFKQKDMLLIAASIQIRLAQISGQAIDEHASFSKF